MMDRIHVVWKGSWKEREVGNIFIKLERMKLRNLARSWNVTLLLILNFPISVTTFQLHFNSPTSLGTFQLLVRFKCPFQLHVSPDQMIGHEKS